LYPTHWLAAGSSSSERAGGWPECFCRSDTRNYQSRIMKSVVAAVDMKGGPARLPSPALPACLTACQLDLPPSFIANLPKLLYLTDQIAFFFCLDNYYSPPRKSSILHYAHAVYNAAIECSWLRICHLHSLAAFNNKA
jgi:hypothetical protein